MTATKTLLIKPGLSFHGKLSGRKKKRQKKKFLGRIFLGHQGPTRRGVPDKSFMQGAFSCCFAHGCPAIWVGTSRDQKNFVQETLGCFFVPLPCKP